MKKTINFIYILFLLIFCIFYFANLAPENSLLNKNIFQQLAPQGFAFYSKSPRDEQFLIYSDNNDIYLPNFKVENIGGWKRKGRAQAIEIGRLDATIPEKYWKSCYSEKNCISLQSSDSLSPYIVKKDEKFKNVNKGTYYIIRAEPLSYSFLKYKDTTTTKNKIVKVKII